MCGRFVSSSPPDQLAQYFDVDAMPEQLLDRGPNFNTAPTTGVYVVYEDGQTRHMDAFRWGLVPSWAKDMSIGARMINSRAETVASKPAFRKAFADRRCIIPADGFYEWKVLPGEKKKQPYFIHRPDGEPFAFAGLWERWKGPKPAKPPKDAPVGDVAETGDGADVDAAEKGDVPKDPNALPPPSPVDPLKTCSIITTTANSTMSELHDRMPVILPRSAWEQWLSPDEHDLDTLGQLLVPAPPELITFHAVSTEVNNARNKGEHLMDEIDPATGELIGG
ncbi:SOS response-associated peptidase [soil metagenome]